MLRGLHEVARQRPVSWADASALPSQGCWCSCRKSQNWWRECDAPKGWRCGVCHPPIHLAPDLDCWIDTTVRASHDRMRK
jgi:hypothetical protein